MNIKETVKNFIYKTNFWELDYPKTKTILNQICSQLRAESYNKKFVGFFFVNELTKKFINIANCGFQKDILNSLSEGALSFNKSWIDEIDLSRGVNQILLKPKSTQLSKQLDALFIKHKVTSYFVITIRCSNFEHIVALEVNHHDFPTHYFSDLTPSKLIPFAEHVYLAYLKSFKDSHLSDWEKAVHELASPLDFIYSNSDFLIAYLNRNDLPIDKKIKKLEDLKNISELLLKRLHQFRFAFAGTSSIKIRAKTINLLDLCMPITHLWYHDAQSKHLTFNYDELRGKTVVTDEEILQFIIFNLLSNAIKYSYKFNEIKLYAKINLKNFQLGITNIGIPISDLDSSQIFDFGFRAENAQEMDARGLGVGLDVCRNLASELGGRVYLKSSSGNPTVFEVDLPIITKER